MLSALVPSGLSAMSILCMAILVPILYLLIWIVYTRTFHPLSRVPGPFLASVTRLWFAINTIRGHMDEVERSLHEKYGPIVRVAPDEVVCADPDAIRKIYPFSDPLRKTDFYSPWGTGREVFSKHPDLFTELNEKKHSERRRIVNHIYTLSNVLRFEPFIDECSEVFLGKIGQLADAGKVVDIGEWFQWYAFDIVGQLFFGKMFGFMTEAKDHRSWIAALDTLTPLFTAMSCLPAYARPWVLKSAIFSKAARKGLDAMGCIIDATKDAVSQTASSNSIEDGQNRSDLLQQMFDVVRTKGEKVDFTIGDVQVESHIAIFAGSDTTAGIFRGVMYYLMKHPDIYRQVQAEIDQAAENGQLSSPVRYSEAIKLPLFCATIKEATRLFPSVALSLSRHAPVGGIELAGTYIPQGYRIGMNPATVQYNRQVFGADADKFRPSRWLEGNAPNMEKHMLAFGAGTRTCIGKHIALTEIHKLLPDLMRNFSMELVDPAKKWTTSNMFIHKQTGIHVNVKRRVQHQ